jgi:polyhydroxybutyrate depolymerase
MRDLKARFAELEGLPAPDLQQRIQTRVQRLQQSGRAEAGAERAWQPFERRRRLTAWTTQILATAAIVAFALGLALIFHYARPVVPAKPTPIPSGVQHPSLMVDGQKRTYRLFLPPSLDPKRPAPLVLVLHAFFSTGDLAASRGHWDDEAGRGEFIVASPENPDIPFVGRLLDRLESQFAVDRTRIFIVGGDTSASLAYLAACELADRIAAMASVMGEMSPEDCRPARPVSILAMHGTDDWKMPYEGAARTIQRWVTLDGCAGNPTQTQSGITKTSIWSGCRQRTVVRFDTVVGGHHTWFGNLDMSPVPGEPDATTVVWDFFKNLAPRA